MQLASPEVQQEWLPDVASGDKVILFGATEPDYGSDLSAIKTKAVKTGDGYIINGEKTSITFGMQGDAIVALAAQYRYQQYRHRAA